MNKMKGKNSQEQIEIVDVDDDFHSEPIALTSITNRLALNDTASDQAVNVGMNLGSTKGIFKNGQWYFGKDESVVRQQYKDDEQIEKLAVENDHLKKEVNMLKLKMEMLLDMLTTTTVENQALHRKTSKNSSRQHAPKRR